MAEKSAVAIAVALAARACKLGVSTNCRTEMRGDDGEPAVDFTITDFLLEKDELNELFGALTYESLFNEQGAGKAPQVLHPKFGPRTYSEKHKGSVAIVLGPNQKDIELDDVKLTNIKIEPLEGGLTKLTLQVQVSEDVEKFVNKLVARQGTEIEAEIGFGDTVQREKSKQKELPMDHAGATAKGKDEKAGKVDDEAAGKAHTEALANSKPTKPATTRRRNGATAH